MNENGDGEIVARIRALIARRPVTSVLAVGGVVLLIAAAVAIPLIASKSSQVSDLQSDLATSNAKLATSNAALNDTLSERDKARAVARSIRSRRDEIISNANTQAKQLVSGAKSELGDLDGKIQQAKSDLTSTEGKLSSVNASLQQAQQTKQMSTFSDGTWSVGQDILAGTYRSTAGSNCYWELLRSPSSGALNNIIDNGFGPNATVTISDGEWLRVEDCGQWSVGP